MILLGYNDMSEDEFKEYIVDYYEVDYQQVNKYDVLIASGGHEMYDEWSFFLLRDKETGELFENHALSCSGFEGQFKPTKTSLTYLKSNKFYATGLDNKVMRKCIKQLNL